MQFIRVSYISEAVRKGEWSEDVRDEVRAASLRRSAGKAESGCWRRCEVEDVGFSLLFSRRFDLVQKLTGKM